MRAINHRQERPLALRSIWCILSVLLALVSAAPPGSAADAKDAKRVLVLHSFGRDFKPWNEYGKAIRTELQRQSPWPVEIFDYSLVAARASDEGAEKPFVDYLEAVFASRKLDLIICIGAPAASFVQRHRLRLFSEIPLVLTAVDERRVQFSKLTANDTVVPVHINYRAAVENILQVLPDTQNIMVVVGTSPLEKFWKEAIAEELEPIAGRFNLSWTDQMSFEDVLKTASKMPQHSAVFWELMIVDAAGTVHEGNAAMARLNAVTNAPIFSYDEAFFGDGMVGGPFLRVADTSRQTAAVGVRILSGEKAGDIKGPAVQFGPPTYDWRQLQRWSIDDARLPPGSVVLFRQPTAWDRYRWQIVAIVLAVLLQTALIHWLLYERRQRRMSEVVVRGTMSELARVNRRATGNELSASIAHEVMQPLTGMVSSANAGLRWLSAPTPDIDKARAMLGQVVAAGHRAADVVRAIRAAFKHERDVKQGVEINETIVSVLGLMQHELEENGVEPRTRLEPNLPVIAADPVQLQQLLLNLMLNAIEAMKSLPSGQSRILFLRSATAEGGVEIGVEDTGAGVASDKLDQIFKPLFSTKPEGLGLGLAICRSIVDAHHGRIWATPVQPHGLAVNVYLPLAAPED